MRQVGITQSQHALQIIAAEVQNTQQETRQANTIYNVFIHLYLSQQECRATDITALVREPSADR